MTSDEDKSRNTESSKSTESKSIFSFILRFVGLLVMVLSGTCSLFFLLADPALFTLVLAVGGVPFVLGLVIFRFGSAKRDPPESKRAP